MNVVIWIDGKKITYTFKSRFLVQTASKAGKWRTIHDLKDPRSASLWYKSTSVSNGNRKRLVQIEDSGDTTLAKAA